ncbi:FAD-dependent monooxygenase yanF [Colletotrichum siamense]|nr:FAD-dependent monooxygenase yanF [Colletotrichum siamense]
MGLSSLVSGYLFLAGFAVSQIEVGFQSHAGQAPPASGYPSCDAVIAAGLSDRVFFPSDQEYNSSVTSYWSGSAASLRPWCIVKPESAEEVSKAFSALVNTSPAGNWDIAVRGGGHSHFPSNNVAQGVTIDLSRMNSTVYKNCSVSSDSSNSLLSCDKNSTSEKGTLSIGPGARWAGVYEEVEKHGDLTVTGGRGGNVGVSGLTLGGGASYHTGYRGFACDDVKNYEVVLADGTIVNANAGENPDLYKALKGGSNNFGIVTRFDMQTFSSAPGGLYGGLIFMDYAYRDTVMKQFVRLIDINEQHPEDTEVVTFTYSGEGPPMIAIVAINTAGVSNSTSFAPLSTLPTILDDRKRKTYGTAITDHIAVGGPRSAWFSICFQNDIEVMNKMAELYDQLLVDLKAVIPSPDLGVAFVSQPLPKYFATTGNGNNVLGLDISLTHDSIIWLGQVYTRTAEQESLAQAKLAAVTAELEAFAEAIGKSTSWRYLNYVNPAQDPIKTYGDENVKFLKEVAAKYDPTGVFQTRVPGGFKISKVFV